MNGRRIVIAIGAAAAAVPLPIFVTADAGRHVRSVTKSPVTEPRRKELQRIDSDYRTALFAWRGRHDLTRAKSLLEGLVHKHEMDAAVFDLAALCTEQGNYKEALECYRDVFARDVSASDPRAPTPYALPQTSRSTSARSSRCPW